jgi:hypothetical protein
MRLINAYRSINSYKPSTYFGTELPSSGSYSEQRSARAARACRYCVACIKIIKMLKFQHFRVLILINVLLFYNGHKIELSQSLPLLPTHGRCRRCLFSLGHTQTHTLQSVGLLWTRDRPDAETSTWQHKYYTSDKNPCPLWDSDPRSQQALGRRPTP